MIISIINHAGLKKEEVQKVLRAINRRLADDFKKYWHRAVKLRLEGTSTNQPNPSDPIDMRGDAVIYLWDEEDVEDALGYHDLNAKGIPYGFVFTKMADRLKEDWSVTLSHEALELAMDPEVNLLASGPHPDPSEAGRIVYHWYEICDAVQSSIYYIDGVAVSNFLLPHYFTEGNELNNHNDFLGDGIGSFEVGTGGYVGFYDPETGSHEQWFPQSDEKATTRQKIKQEFYGVTRVGRHSDGEDESPFTDVNAVHCDALVFELNKKKFKGLQEARIQANEIIRTVLGTNWDFQIVEGDPWEFDALYRGTRGITFSEAWELAHVLAQVPEVAYAEPSLSNPAAGETDLAVDRAATIRASSIGHRDLPGTEDPLWALDACNVPAAWQLFASDGKEPGENIIVGHPDSGYRPHPEMDPSRIIASHDYDFIENDDDPVNLKGNHGLATASVIMSGQGGLNDKVKGPAWAASIVPLRVTKPGLIRPTPVLLLGGMRRLRNSIDYARRIGCHLISMSLGGLPSRSVRKAIRRATDEGMLVLSAAGNEVGFVVWPARYDDVIAVAGSNIEGKPWSGSSRGKDVDITAPAESVWRARYDKDKQETGRGEGTSYAVALTAGVAAMWLSYHGRDQLVQQYGASLQEVFRKLIKQTANTNHSLPDGKFGAGLVDAAQLLSANLPNQSPRVRRAAVITNVMKKDLAEKVKMDSADLSEQHFAELQMAEALGAWSDTEYAPNRSSKRKSSKSDRKVLAPKFSATLRNHIKQNSKKKKTKKKK